MLLERTTGKQCTADRSGSILELAVFHSLRTSNLPSYRSYNASLTPFYSIPSLPASPNRPVVLGLHLLALLSEGQLTEFHTLMERLQVKELEDAFVKLPVDLYVSASLSPPLLRFRI